jgi:ABC-type multidrug transport system fused ATPase/permease subunit
MMVSIFGFYMFFGGVLDVANLNTILQIFNRFKKKIYRSADLINTFTEALVSIRRLNNFLVSEEIDDQNVIEHSNLPNDDNPLALEAPEIEEEKKLVFPSIGDGDTSELEVEYAIQIENGNFYWVDRKNQAMLEKRKAEQKKKDQNGCCGCIGGKKKNKTEPKKEKLRSKDTEGPEPKGPGFNNFTGGRVLDSNPWEQTLLHGNKETFLDEQNRADDTDQSNDSDTEEKPDKSKGKNGKPGIDETSDESDDDQDRKKTEQDEADMEESKKRTSKKIGALEEPLLDHSDTKQQAPRPADDFIPFLDLKNINLKIKKGSCVAIIGKTGCGKTSLLHTLFGEMYPDFRGDAAPPKVTLNSQSISYVAQNDWVQSKTIKENILFYSDYNEQVYNDSIKYAGMTDDLAQLPDKDRTMLGDKGVNLSGGQRTRLSIARALYAEREIIIMDDPISALDVNVGKFIMEHTITGFLKSKTRVVVTHAISY